MVGSSGNQPLPPPLSDPGLFQISITKALPQGWSPAQLQEFRKLGARTGIKTKYLLLYHSIMDFRIHATVFPGRG